VTITIFAWLIGLGFLLVIVPRLLQRLLLSRAKHRSLAGHAKLGRRLARLIPYYEYDEAHFFRADDAPEPIAEQRRAAFAWPLSMPNASPTPFARPTKSRTKSPTCNSRPATASPSSSAASSAGT
jgi:hypothetical protein